MLPNGIIQSSFKTSGIYNFIVGLIIQSIMAGQMRTTMFNGYHKSVYENYMNEMEGEYSIRKRIH